LAVAGLRIFGSENKLLELAAHPLDLLTGHRLAADFEELARLLRERFGTYERIQNEDLDRAIMRSAWLASLFCLLDASPEKPSGVGAAKSFESGVRVGLPQTLFEVCFRKPMYWRFVRDRCVRDAVEALTGR